MSPRLPDEFAHETVEPFDVPFRFLSNFSLHDLFGEGLVEQLSLPTTTPLHDPTPMPGLLDFLDQPLEQCKRSVRPNREPDYAFSLCHVEKWQLQRIRTRGMPTSEDSRLGERGSLSMA